MVTLKSLLGSLLLLACVVVARSSTGDKVLVVLDPSVVKDEYSKFWESLQDRGFALTFKGPKDESAELVRYGQQQFDHLIMFAPSAKSFASPLSPQNVLSSQLTSLNTLYILSPSLSDLQRDTFREYDVEFVDRDNYLLDAFSHLSSKSPSTVLLHPSSSLVASPILSASTLSGGPIVYPSGTVHTLGLNPYLIDVLHASKTSYVGDESGSPEEGSRKGEVLSGKTAGLVSAMQTRENVRIGWIGSGGMLSDEWWGVKVDGVETGNAGFIQDLSKWIFQETGVVKVISSTHHKLGETEPRELYRIKDDLTYSLTLAQHTTTSNGTSDWVPVSLEDLQLDFTMLDPYVRTALPEDKSISSPDSTTYTANFQAPDRHGVFKFVVEYWRPGWSYIRSSTTASVTPFRHDDYARFIVGAWPYYTAAISISGAFLLFVSIWVGLGEGGSASAKGKKKAE
ncbi:oligosaccharyltransferase complex subunit beta, partial [Tremellales sp. Uapishka_1]